MWRAHERGRHDKELEFRAGVPRPQCHWSPAHDVTPPLLLVRLKFGAAERGWFYWDSSGLTPISGSLAEVVYVFFLFFYMIFLKVRLPIIILVVVSIRLMSENFINWFVTSRGQSWKGNLFLTVLLYDFWCTAGSRGNCGGMPLIPEVRNSQHHQLESLFNQVHRFQPEMVAARHKNLWTRTTRGYKSQKNPRSIPRASETSHEE